MSLSSCPGTVWSLFAGQFTGIPGSTLKIGAGIPIKAFREVQNEKIPLDLLVRLAGNSRGVRWSERPAESRFQEEFFGPRKGGNHRAQAGRAIR